MSITKSRIVSNIVRFFTRRSTDVSDWYKVGFDQNLIWRDVNPPGRDSFRDSVKWKDINRVAFEVSDYPLSEHIYVFSVLRPESYLIPTEAHGAESLWAEIVKRGLFDPALAIEASLSQSGLFVWPPEES